MIWVAGLKTNRAGDDPRPFFFAAKARGWGEFAQRAGTLAKKKKKCKKYRKSGRRPPDPHSLIYNFPPACKAYFRARAFSATAMGVGPRMWTRASRPQAP